MSEREWLDAYREAWDAYYTAEHVETVMRRAREWRFPVNKVKWMTLAFYGAASIEGVHPLDSGLFRRKYRHDRRPGLPRETPVAFYGGYLREIVWKYSRFLRLYVSYQRIYRRVMQGRSRPAVADVAMQPANGRELDEMELFAVTDAARTAADRIRAKTQSLRETNQTAASAP
jgi:hypothetical protein